jgi:hypothetical protein
LALSDLLGPLKPSSSLAAVKKQLSRVKSKKTLELPLHKREVEQVSYIESGPLGWRDGSTVKSTNCSYEGPEFKSQQPHGGSQPSVMRSDALFWGV